MKPMNLWQSAKQVRKLKGDFDWGEWTLPVPLLATPLPDLYIASTVNDSTLDRTPRGLNRKR